MRFLGFGSTPLVAVLIASFAISFATDARADDELSRELDLLEGEMGRIEGAYATDLSLETLDSFQKRLQMGEYLFVTANYEAASLVLYAAVDPSSGKNYESQTGYARATYQLAESLYQLKNLSGARTYFAHLLGLREKEHKTLSMNRLITIAEQTRDHEGLSAWYERYRTMVETVPSGIRYAHGRSLMLQGRDQDAMHDLKSIKEGDLYYLRARYLLGAALVRAGELSKAVTLFQNAAKLTPRAKVDSDVLELCNLARGRLFYELDKLDAAVDAYQEIPWDSKQLNDMLFEITWTYVRRGQLANNAEEGTAYQRAQKAKTEYKSALEQLRDLELLEGESERSAELRLLNGSLRLQRGDFDGAHTTFTQVLDRYAAEFETLRSVLSDPSKRGAILNDILAVEAGGLSVETQLPPAVALRAAGNKDVAAAVRVFREIQVSRREIEVAGEMATKLSALLDSDTRAELFPELREGLSRSIGLHNRLLHARQRVFAKYDDAKLSLDKPTTAEFKKVRQRRKKLGRQIDTLPRDSAGLESRLEGFSKGTQRLDREHHRVDSQVQKLRAQLNAIDHLFSEGGMQTSTAPKTMENTKRKIRELGDVIDALESETAAISSELETLRLGTTISGGKGARERELREAYERLAEREVALLGQGLGEKAPDLALIQARIEKVGGRNAQFRSALDTVVDRHLSHVRALVEEEKRNLGQYAASVEAVNRAAASVREGASILALQAVGQHLENIILRADVGVIDTAFARKQEKTETIGRIQRDRAAALTDLNQAYADLTRDEEVD